MTVQSTFAQSPEHRPTATVCCREVQLRSSMLQRVAADFCEFTRVPPAASESCDTVLQHATHCNTLQHTATHTTHCNTHNTLQHTATHLPECRLQRLSHAIRYCFGHFEARALIQVQHQKVSSLHSFLHQKSMELMMTNIQISGTLRRGPSFKRKFPKNSFLLDLLHEWLWS